MDSKLSLSSFMKSCNSTLISSTLTLSPFTFSLSSSTFIFKEDISTLMEA
uniref:Uncharacterized protein n=1 Tax=Rhizophora mucronata TaxID=61149 RepID=A0A2P2IIY9_RHIMU